MTPPVTLPGDLPGLLRRGAPGFVGRASAMIIGTWRDGGWRACFEEYGETHPIQALRPDELRFFELDLTNPAGMDIAARWLAEQLGLKVGWTAPTFVFVERLGAPEQDGELQHVAGWMLVCDGGDVEMFFAEPVIDENGDRRGVHVPGLTLDPAKGPEALAQICLHVAGRRVGP